MQRHPVRTVAIVLLGSAVALRAEAAGFALLEQNASLMGNAMAGSAASAQDASTVYFNPAGLTQLKGIQLVAGLHGIHVSAKFSGTGSNSGGFALNGTGGDAGVTALVPNVYFSVPIGERLALGVGVNPPFGLASEYDDNWLGRFQGIKSELKTVNVNPSVAFKVSEVASLGFGLNIQRAQAELTNAVFLGVEGRTKLKADDNGWGWNAGALFQLGSDMRLGVAYRSRIEYKLDGNVATTNLAGTPLAAASFDATAEITFPDTATLSLVQKYGENWELLGDLMWTHWSVVDRVFVIDKSSGATRDTLIFNFNDAWRWALGINYHHNEQWTFKGGFAYDQSPVDDATRSVRLPDTDRYWLSLGAKFRFSKLGAVDIAYSHLFGKSGAINSTRTQAVPSFTSTVTGSYATSVDIISAQVTLSF